MEVLPTGDKRVRTGRPPVYTPEEAHARRLERKREAYKRNKEEICRKERERYTLQAQAYRKMKERVQ